MTCKISAKIKAGDRRKEVLMSRILYLLSDITGVFFGKTTKNMDYPTPQSIKGCQRLIQFDNLLSKRWRVLIRNIKPIQKSLLGSKKIRQPDSFPTHSSSSASCRTKCSSNSSCHWENLHLFETLLTISPLSLEVPSWIKKRSQDLRWLPHNTNVAASWWSQFFLLPIGLKLSSDNTEGCSPFYVPSHYFPLFAHGTLITNNPIKTYLASSQQKKRIS